MKKPLLQKKSALKKSTRVPVEIKLGVVLGTLEKQVKPGAAAAPSTCIRWYCAP